MLNCIIVDDDGASVDKLSRFIRKIPGFRIWKMYTSPLDALQELTCVNSIDVIFINFEMPSISGIELARLLRHKCVHLIFTASQPDYAIEAFHADADGFLLKPFSLIRFAEIMQKIVVRQENFIEKHEGYFYIQTGGKSSNLLRIDPEEIILIQQVDGLYQIETTESNHNLKSTEFRKIFTYLRRCPDFIQVNMSTIISKNHIKKITANTVELKGNLSVQPSGIFQKNLNEFIRLKMFRSALKRKRFDCIIGQ